MKNATPQAGGGTVPTAPCSAPAVVAPLMAATFGAGQDLSASSCKTHKAKLVGMLAA